MVAIFVKESLGEYGSGWGWDSNAHVFDQTNAYQEYSTIPEGTPIKYLDNGTAMTYCYNDIEISNGQILLSNSIMLDQISCKPNTGNAGNWYNWIASTVNGGSSSNSICPKGWTLGAYSEGSTKSI